MPIHKQDVNLKKKLRSFLFLYHFGGLMFILGVNLSIFICLIAMRKLNQSNISLILRSAAALFRQ